MLLSVSLKLNRLIHLSLINLFSLKGICVDDTCRIYSICYLVSSFTFGQKDNLTLAL